MLRNIAWNDCSNMANKLTKRKYYMMFQQNNSRDCGRERKARVIDINRRDETPVMRSCDE